MSLFKKKEKEKKEKKIPSQILFHSLYAIVGLNSGNFF